MRALIVLVALSGCILAACSRSPAQALVETDEALSQRLMGNLVETDASRQTNALIRNIDARPDCQSYIDELRRAGRDSPYEGATQWTITHTYDDAQKAGCVKPL
jgi:hypothetical protein